MYRPASKDAKVDSTRSEAVNLAKRAPNVVVYNVLYRKKSNKKHKTWEGDGTASLENGFLAVQANGRRIASIKINGEIEEGAVLVGSNYEVEIEDVRPAPQGPSTVTKPRVDIEPVHLASLPPNSPKRIIKRPASYGDKPAERPKSKPSTSVTPDGKKMPVPRNAHTSGSELAFAPFKPPLKSRPSTSQSEDASQLKRFKPQPTSVPAFEKFKVPLKQTKERSAREPAKPASEDIDALVLSFMRPHQIEGTKFLRDCVLGSRHLFGSGAILADDMGLGKTLMAVALIYTLLKQGHIKNALVVCPVSLLQNWKKEFRKWLGEMRLGVQVIDQDADPKIFFRDLMHKTYQVMVIGYERVYKLAALMSERNYPEFDLVVCDEGHRLKSTASRLASSILDVCGDRRVILTGTPIQNNLDEFWALCEFVNPGCLGSASKFARRFADPIAAGKVPNAPDILAEIAQERTDELSEISSSFMLRRDQKVLEKYLTVPKTEFVVFCRPTRDQLRVYGEILNSTDISNLFSMRISSNNAQFLQAITLLKQASNSLNIPPSPRAQSPAQDEGVQNPRPEKYSMAASSSKLAVLSELLNQIRATTKEKCVVVSGSTKVLDLCQDLCVSNRMQWLRLDGQTPQDRRQGIVDIFNKSGPDRAFAFLLSARSGGVGLNLIGGSRLILFDCDWNPAIDSQAMARIHRDGQTRPTFIYRLMTTGLIDEKIFQRQLSKHGMADSILYARSEGDDFTNSQLKDLFTITEPEKCNTLELATTKNYVEERLEHVQDAPLAATMEKVNGKISCVLRRVNT